MEKTPFETAFDAGKEGLLAVGGCFLCGSIADVGSALFGLPAHLPEDRHGRLHLGQGLLAGDLVGPCMVSST